MCPPGVDQTMRSDQRWQFLAPELRQAEELQLDQDSYGSERLTPFFARRKRWNAWSKLARPIIPPSTKPSIRRLQYSPPSPFDVLSQELFDILISYLILIPRDLLAFGLACERFWAMTNRAIHAQYIKTCAPWAGTKLSFQGSYSTDLPAAFDKDLVKSITGETWFGNMFPARRFFWNHCDFNTPDTVQDLETDYVEWMGQLRDGSGIPEKKWRAMIAGLKCPDLFPQNDRIWVLRNLTTREIVTTERAFTRSRPWRGHYFPMNHPDNFRLEEILLMRICWTNIPSDDDDEELGVHRGIWAGHAFEILCLEDHEKEGGEWKDVSSELEMEARETWDKAKRLMNKLESRE